MNEFVNYLNSTNNAGSDSTGSLLKVLMIGVSPLVYLGVGVCVIVRRRRKQNEPL